MEGVDVKEEVGREELVFGGGQVCAVEGVWLRGCGFGAGVFGGVGFGVCDCPVGGEGVGFIGG